MESEIDINYKKQNSDFLEIEEINYSETIQSSLKKVEFEKVKSRLNSERLMKAPPMRFMQKNILNKELHDLQLNKSSIKSQSSSSISNETNFDNHLSGSLNSKSYIENEKKVYIRHKRKSTSIANDNHKEDITPNLSSLSLNPQQSTLSYRLLLDQPGSFQNNQQNITFSNFSCSDSALEQSPSIADLSNYSETDDLDILACNLVATNETILYKNDESLDLINKALEESQQNRLINQKIRGRGRPAKKDLNFKNFFNENDEIKPYRGGRKRDQPPPNMTLEEKIKWEKIRHKKDTHNIIEKNRRNKINNLIVELNEMVENGILEYSDEEKVADKKGEMLDGVKKYMVKLINEVNKLRLDNKSLKTQIEVLEKENTNYIQEIVPNNIAIPRMKSGIKSIKSEYSGCSMPITSGTILTAFKSNFSIPKSIQHSSSSLPKQITCEVIKRNNFKVSSAINSNINYSLPNKTPQNMETSSENNSSLKHNFTIFEENQNLGTSLNNNFTNYNSYSTDYNILPFADENYTKNIKIEKEESLVKKLYNNCLNLNKKYVNNQYYKDGTDKNTNNAKQMMLIQNDLNSNTDHFEVYDENESTYFKPSTEQNNDNLCLNSHQINNAFLKKEMIDAGQFFLYLQESDQTSDLNQDRYLNSMHLEQDNKLVNNIMFYENTLLNINSNNTNLSDNTFTHIQLQDYSFNSIAKSFNSFTGIKDLYDQNIINTNSFNENTNKISSNSDLIKSNTDISNINNINNFINEDLIYDKSIEEYSNLWNNSSIDFDTCFSNSAFDNLDNVLNCDMLCFDDSLIEEMKHM